MRSLSEVEKEHILAVYKHCDGDITASSRMLGVSRATLYRKLKKYGVK